MDMKPTTIDIFLNDVNYGGTKNFIKAHRNMTLKDFASLPLIKLLRMVDDSFGKLDTTPVGYPVNNPVRVKVVLGELVPRMHRKGLLMCWEVEEDDG